MPAALVLAFVLVPLVEIYLISKVAHLVGLPLTLGILLLLSVLGAILVKREGVRTWRTLRATIGAGRLPARELADAALVLVGGVLLLTPGFLTDACGVLLVLPPTRALARRGLTALALHRAVPGGLTAASAAGGMRRRSSRPRGSAPAAPPTVIEGVVVEGAAGPPNAERPRAG